MWDKLRTKVRDVEAQLPPGTGRPDVSDDFGDVFGFQIALTAEGFSYAELEAYAKNVKKELSLVEGVARVDLWGVQDKAIYLDVAQTQLSELGITDSNLKATLSQPADPIEPEIYLQFRTRRIGRGYHVIALGHGLEHVHRPFPTRRAAWRPLPG